MHQMNATSYPQIASMHPYSLIEGFSKRFQEQNSLEDLNMANKQINYLPQLDRYLWLVALESRLISYSFSDMLE